MRTKPILIALAIAAALSYRAKSSAGGGFGFTDAAINFQNVAITIYQQGTDVCGAECEPTFSGALSNLGATLGPLNTAIGGGNPQQIRDAVANTAGTLPPLCSALRVECPLSPLGAEPSEKEPDGMLRCDCERLEQREDDCEREANAAERACVEQINEYVGCRLQTPFCDWRDAPFDAAQYAACRTRAYYRQYLQECRCPVPPGQAERQGGCPGFFTQPLGQVGTAQCEVSERSCARCCYAKCVGTDSRLSCQGGNREECDVCDWARKTRLAGDSMRGSLCSRSAFNGINRCVQQYLFYWRACH
jgi:hypothetical protein